MATEVKVFEFDDEIEDAESEPIPFKIRYKRRVWLPTPDGTKSGDAAAEKAVVAADEAGHKVRVHYNDRRYYWDTAEIALRAKPSSEVPPTRVMMTVGAFVGTGPSANAAVIDFFDRCLVATDVAIFRDLVDNEDVQIRVEQLARLMGWLFEKYGERPTKSA